MCLQLVWAHPWLFCLALWASGLVRAHILTCMNAIHTSFAHWKGMLESPAQKRWSLCYVHSSTFYSCVCHCFLLCISILIYPGGNARMAQFFRGNLAGLMIRSGKLENKKVIDCLYTCKEGLDVQLPEEVASAVKVKSFRNTLVSIRLDLCVFVRSNLVWGF